MQAFSIKILLALFLSFLTSPVGAFEGAMTYEKYLRLNDPAYRSSSGDWLNFSFQTKAPEPDFGSYVEGDVRLYFQDNNDFAYSLQEAYLTGKFQEYDWSVGRKILDWNQNEHYWGLGYLNASQGFSLLGDDLEGVSGLFIKRQFGDIEIEGVVSYFFIPALNPAIEIKNGEVRAKNDWVRLPPTRTLYNARLIPLSYQIGDIDYSKIIFNKSMGLNTRYLYSKGWFSAFALYKPENRLRINASAAYDPALDKVVVNANPTVNHHAYYGVLWQHWMGSTRALGGLSYVDPNTKIGKDINLLSIENGRQEFESAYFSIKPRYDREAYSHFSLNFDRGEYALSLNYIHLLSNNIRGADDFYSDTVKWKRAFGAKINYTLSDHFSLEVNYKYDVSRKDEVLKAEIQYELKKRVTCALGVEALKAPREDSYWTYYRSNDIVYTTIGVFY